MSQLDAAVTRYNKLLETGPCSDLAWAEALHARMESTRLSAGGRLVCPFLRPNFITRRQYDSLVKTGEFLISAIDRIGEDPTVHDHLGDVYFKLGKIKEAITQWQASLKDFRSPAGLDSEPEDVTKVTKKLDAARVKLAKESK